MHKPDVWHGYWSRHWLSAPVCLVLALNCALLPCCSAEHSKLPKSHSSSASLPESLQRLLSADRFEDSVRGESPDLPKNYASYLAAAKLIPNLDVDNLLYVRDHALPAGRIYAAILLKQSGKSDTESFGKLLQDKAPVTYLSGCKGMPATVSEIAQSFADAGRFHNFTLVTYCTMPPPLNSAAEVQAACLASLSAQTIVQHYAAGDSNQPSEAWRTFHLLLSQGADAKPAALSLANSHSSGARIYGAVLLRRIDAAEGEKLLKSWVSDKSKVVLSSGCVRQESTVGALSERLLMGEEVILLADPRQKKP